MCVNRVVVIVGDDGPRLAHPLTVNPTGRRSDGDTLLLGLTLQILVGTESKSTAEEDDSVEDDA